MFYFLGAKDILLVPPVPVAVDVPTYHTMDYIMEYIQAKISSVDSSIYFYILLGLGISFITFVIIMLCR